jgi:hypothetical protein
MFDDPTLIGCSWTTLAGRLDAARTVSRWASIEPDLSDLANIRPTQLIPACWPRHPHLANELPVLAFTRWLAEDSLGPESIKDWHRYALPMFLDRMTSRIGESSCRTGKHQDWPAESRYTAFFSDELANDRADVIHIDSHPAIPLHALQG